MNIMKKLSANRLMLLVMLTVFCLILFQPKIAKASKVTALQRQQASLQQELKQNNNELAQKVATVNQTYQQLKSVQQQQAQTNKRLKQAQKELSAAKKQKQQRITQEKLRIRNLQQTEGTQAGLQLLQQSKNFSQWFGNLVALGRLQAAYNQSMTAVSQSIKVLHNSQKKLTLTQASLKQQSTQIATKKTELNNSVRELQSLVNNNQQKIKLLANQVSWAKETEKKQQAAAQLASETAAKNSTAAASSTSKVGSSTSSVSTTASSTSSTANSGSSSDVAASRTLTMQATGYSTAEAGASGYSALGINLKQHPSCVAVDPSVIPLGSVIWVSGYGVSIAGDTGGAIKGNIIDLHFASVGQATAWGRRTVTVKILN
ncbi:MAG: 3D domain-containing protein [Liquorilactobacillus ghanensis]|uniref:3D domain-containing protein n=1 Tax=Liquorilactobacillus ghanensis TaxID=399370 RepID=UPI0039ECE459